MFPNRFPLHDRTRRRVVRALFVLLCLAPTAAVAAWVAAHYLPGRHAAIETEWRQRLGLRVTIGRIAYPRPGEVRLTRLTLSDPETGVVVAQTPRVEIARRKFERGATQVLSIETIEVDPARLAELRQVVERRLRWGVDTPARIHAANVQWFGGGQPISSFQMQLEPLADGGQVSLSFRPADSPENSPIRFRAIRRHAAGAPTLRWELNTGQSAIPCSWFADLGVLDELAELGGSDNEHSGRVAPDRDALAGNTILPETRFSGYIWANQTRGLWEAELTGQLVGSRLENLLPRESAARSTGPVHLWIERARLVAMRLEDATLRISAGPGEIDAAALGRWMRELGLRATAPPPVAGAVSYDQIALRVSLDADGLNLRGACRNAPEGTVMIAGGRAVLYEPAARRLPLAAVVRAVTPAAHSYVPATESAQRLARWLPLPGADRLQTTKATAPRE